MDVGSCFHLLLFDVCSEPSYTVYAFSSLLAFDPWHMFTSFIPYMLLSPTYINILNMWVIFHHETHLIRLRSLFKSVMHFLISTMYVFHACSSLIDSNILSWQISWGTKQDSTPERDLGAVIQDSHSQVDVEMLTEAADVNSIYEEALLNLRDRVPVDKTQGKGLPTLAEKEANAKDYYANVRTNVLLAWVLSNVCVLFSLFPFSQMTLLHSGLVVGWYSWRGAVVGHV